MILYQSIALKMILVNKVNLLCAVDLGTFMGFFWQHPLQKGLWRVSWLDWCYCFPLSCRLPFP